jgi:hypothetical protein
VGRSDWPFSFFGHNLIGFQVEAQRRGNRFTFQDTRPPGAFRGEHPHGGVAGWLPEYGGRNLRGGAYHGGLDPEDQGGLEPGTRPRLLGL